MPEVSEELMDEDYRISGDIYVIQAVSDHVSDDLEDMLLTRIENHGQVIVKLAGNAISIVRDGEALHQLLHNTARNNDPVDIPKALLDVVYICEKKSHIYMIVDNEEQFTEDAEMVLMILKDSSIRVDVIDLRKGDHERKRRQAVNLYQLLANVSGGSVITTDKNNIGNAVNIITQSLQTTRVNIMRFSYPKPAGDKFSISVDDTMKKLVVKVQAEKAQPVMIATNPAGLPSIARPQSIGVAAAGSVIALLEINITTAADCGRWNIMKMDPSLWDVTVQGDSPVDFTHQFVEPGPGGFGEYPIKGRPIAKTVYKMVVTVPEYAKVNKVAVSFLMIRDSLMPKGFGPLTNVGGRRGQSIFYTNITIPEDPFMIAIEGRDKTSHTFRRIDPSLITPVTLKLFVPPMSGVVLLESERLDIPFTVYNAGAKEQDIDVKIEDDQSFAMDPKIHSYTIKAGQNETGHFTLKAGTKGGVTTTVTINAKPFLGISTFSQGQFELRRFTVKEKEDHVDPTCNITNIQGTCNFGVDPCACVNYTWSADMEIGDVGLGLDKVEILNASVSYTFKNDPFTSGYNISMGIVKAKIGYNCCFQSAIVQATDTKKNTGECEVNVTKNFVPPDLSQCNKTTTTSTSTTTGATTTVITSSTVSSVSSPSSGSSTPSSGSTASSGKTGSATTNTAATGTVPVGSVIGTTKATQSTSPRPGASTNSPSGGSSVTGSSLGALTKNGVTAGTNTGTNAATNTGSSPKGGQSTTAAPQTSNNSDNGGNNNGLTATAIGAGMAIGAVIGVTALAAMALIFKKAMSKQNQSVSPSGERRRHRRDSERDRARRQSNLAWT
ncbi:uncharacterized protein LOC128235855 [Mya arenaria]|uniref:uncharacterized protein LOC128235855 n=1 Tax=Mya arenaria TaxID=6604 RepID=UPI0022E7183E|nr:uncharacterized protein LOC128235855 [Mya arenaria]